MSAASRSDGGPAFPQLEVVAGERDGHGDAIEAYTVSSGGMSLRDWFAGQALAGEMTGYQDVDATRYADAIAARCYAVADAMLAARKGGAA